MKVKNVTLRGTRAANMTRQQVLDIVAVGNLYDALGPPLGRDNEGVGILQAMNLEPEFGER